MDITKQLKEYRSQVLMAGITLFSIIGIFVGVIPLASRSIAQFQTNKNLSDDITVLKAKSEILVSLDEQTLEKNLLDLTEAVPTDKSLGTIFTTLDGVAGASVVVQNFQVTRIGSIATDSAKKLNADESKIGAGILPFSVTVTGQENELRTFLTQVVGVRRMFNIRAVNMTYGPLGVNATVNLDAYYYPLPVAIGALTEPITQLSDKEEATLTMVQRLPLQSSFAYAPASESAVTVTGKEDPFSL